jgi:repressor LexA
MAQRSTPLTEPQKRFLELLVSFRQREGRPPTVRELQDLAGFRSPRSVSQYLEALERAGYIERLEGARNTKIVKSPPVDTADREQTIPVPVVGTVAAGLPLYAEENIEEYLSVSTKLARSPYGYFILRAKGDSMNRAGIDDGDLLLVRQQSTAKAGDQVVALIDDEATVKRFRPLAGAVALEPVSRNSNHKPIIVTSEFRIQGVVVQVIKGGSKLINN